MTDTLIAERATIPTPEQHMLIAELTGDRRTTGDRMRTLLATGG